MKALLDSLQRDLILFSHQARQPQETEAALAALDRVFATDRTIQQAIREESERRSLRQEEARLQEEIKRTSLKLLGLLADYEGAICETEQAIKDIERQLKGLTWLFVNGDQQSLLSLASRLALTHAPPSGPDWTPEQPLRLHRPPYPTEDLLRASLLFQRMNIQVRNGPETQAARKVHVHQETPVGQGETPVGERRLQSTTSRLSTALLDLDLDLNPDL